MKHVWIRRYRAWGVAFAIAMLAACSSVPGTRPASPERATVVASRPADVSPLGAHDNQGARPGTTYSVGVQDADGPSVAAALQARYASAVTACPGGLPAVSCSGVLMRATVRGAYRVWNPNPVSRTPRGVPFSWLRRDAAFSGMVFNYTNGFIVVPYQTALGLPGRYTALEVQCVYAYDADTYNRTTGLRDGCSPHDTETSTNTAPCQSQDIFNADQWLRRFEYAANRYTMQCGFRVSAGTPNAAAVFMALPAIRAKLPNEMWLHDELMVATWGQNDPRVPVEAFFFLAGSAAGLAEARANQADFQAATGHWVPVIQLTLPTSPNGPASFVYTP